MAQAEATVYYGEPTLWQRRLEDLRGEPLYVLPPEEAPLSTDINRGYFATRLVLPEVVVLPNRESILLALSSGKGFAVFDSMMTLRRNPAYRTLGLGLPIPICRGVEGADALPSHQARGSVAGRSSWAVGGRMGASGQRNANSLLISHRKQITIKISYFIMPEVRTCFGRSVIAVPQPRMGGGMFLYPSKTPSGSHCPASGGLIVWDRGLCDGSDEPAPMVRTGRISAVFTGGWGGLAGERKSRQRYLAGFVAGSGGQKSCWT